MSPITAPHAAHERIFKWDLPAHTHMYTSTLRACCDFIIYPWPSGSDEVSSTKPIRSTGCYEDLNKELDFTRYLSRPE